MPARKCLVCSNFESLLSFKRASHVSQCLREKAQRNLVPIHVFLAECFALIRRIAAAEEATESGLRAFPCGVAGLPENKGF